MGCTAAAVVDTWAPTFTFLALLLTGVSTCKQQQTRLGVDDPLLVPDLGQQRGLRPKLAGGGPSQLVI